MQSELTTQTPQPQPLNEDQLLALVTRASALQQSGLNDEALKAYEDLQAADPEGRYGQMAQKAIVALRGKGAIVNQKAAPAPNLSFRGITYQASAKNAEKNAIPLLQKLMNIPIRQKQLLGLLTSQCISIVSLVGIGSVLIVTNLRTQLVSQTTAELAVTKINYNIKIDQMAFGFRGQSDNTAIISAALTGKASPQVLEILRNEVKARQIEYATLVNAKGIVLASANADRTGQPFNPNNLVTTAIQSGKQIKTTEIVTWPELAKEAPPLPEGVANTDALIRYTVTPVRNPANKAIIGALVSGDIVNNKRTIVEQTLQAFNGGYSAIYFQNSQNQLQLAIALKGTEKDNPQTGIGLSNLDLLNQAAENLGQPVTIRQKLNDQPYALAAEAIPNSAGDPIAFLVRGTPEAQIDQVLRQSAIWQGSGVLLVLLIDIGIATLLTRLIVGPLLKLKNSAQKLAAGDTSSRAIVDSQDEVGELAQAFNQMADSIQGRTEQIEQLASEREKEALQQRRQREQLQQRVVELLLEIEGAQQGDLTVKARVSDDEMGSVADAFNATVGSLRQLVTQVQQVTQQVNNSAADSEASVSQLSAQALEQAESITRTVRSVESMAKSIETVATSAMETARIAREASDSASRGGAAMQQTVDSIEELRSSVAETAKKVKRLTESSQEISKIVALISEISSKTNLLAFNASIEAVRAGEHGQGFRIVADEVRRLAEQVSESTKEIEQLVSGIQLETAEVLAMMEKGTSQVVTSTRLVAQTRETLSGLVNISQKIDEFVQAISESTHSQSQMSQEVSQTMHTIAESAVSTSQESQQVSQSLKDLLSIAQQLQISVEKFRVGNAP
jgi:twitching motility protein PilJ